MDKNQTDLNISNDITITPNLRLEDLDNNKEFFKDKKQTLEERFDDEFYIPCESDCASQHHLLSQCDCDSPEIKKKIKSFIRQLLKEERESVDEMMEKRMREIAIEEVKESWEEFRKGMKEGKRR